MSDTSRRLTVEGQGRPRLSQSDSHVEFSYRSPTAASNAWAERELMEDDDPIAKVGGQTLVEPVLHMLEQVTAQLVNRTEEVQQAQALPCRVGAGLWSQVQCIHSPR